MRFLLDLPNKIGLSKTYISALALCLSGAGALVADIAKCDGIGEILGILSSLPNHPGTLLFLNGLAVFGLGHKVEKIVSKK